MFPFLHNYAFCPTSGFFALTRIIPPKKQIDNEKTRWYIDKRLIVKRLIIMTGGVRLDQYRLCKRIMILHMLRRKTMHGAHCEKEIVPGQYPLLKYLGEHPGASQQELAEMLFVTPASVAQSTKRLQRALLLEKAADPENLRRNRLRLTASGRAVVDAFRSHAESVDRQMLSGFTAEEIARLIEMHNRMIQNLATVDDLAMLREMEEQDRANRNDTPSDPRSIHGGKN